MAVCRRLRLLGKGVYMRDLLCECGQKVIASLIIITLIINWRMFSIILDVGLTFKNNLLIVVWVVLLFVAAIGLFLRRTWGLFCFYPAVFLSTIGFSISLLPFAPNLFPLAIRPWAMVGINSVLLLIVIWIHWEKSRGSTNEIA